MTARRRINRGVTLALGGLLAASCGTAPPGSPTVSSPTASGPAVDTPTWSRHHLEAGQYLAAIVEGGPGLIAAGADNTGGAVWTSQDGLSWAAAVPPEPGRVVTDVASGDGRFVAVGSEGEQGARHGIVLTSTDGLAWESAPTTKELANSSSSGSVELSAVAFNAGTWVAVGVEFGSTGQQGGLWTSADGTGWRRASAPDQGSRLSDVSAGGPGFIAVGEAAVPSGQFASTILTSSDGAAWTGLADMTPFDSSLATTVAMADGMTVIGGVRIDPVAGAAVPAFWTSPDGARWSASTVDDPLASTGGIDGEPDFFEGGIVASVARAKSGWIATGSATNHWTESIAIDLAVWVSPDGQTWRRAPHVLNHEAGFASGLQYGGRTVVSWNDTLIVSGSTDTAVGTVWVSPPRAGGVEVSPRPVPPTPGPSAPGGGTDATPAPQAP